MKSIAKTIMDKKEDISLLPLWAQKKIRSLEYDNKTAYQQIDKLINDQTKSPFYALDFVPSEEDGGRVVGKKRYVQADTLHVLHKGVELTIHLDEDGTVLRWGDAGKPLARAALFITGYQTAMIGHGSDPKAGEYGKQKPKPAPEPEPPSRIRRRR